MNETQRESTERAEILLLKSHELTGKDNLSLSFGVVDILTDLRHYCHANQIPFREVLGDSWNYWNEEITNLKEKP